MPTNISPASSASVFMFITCSWPLTQHVTGLHIGVSLAIASVATPLTNANHWSKAWRKSFSVAMQHMFVYHTLMDGYELSLTGGSRRTSSSALRPPKSAFSTAPRPLSSELRAGLTAVIDYEFKCLQQASTGLETTFCGLRKLAYRSGSEQLLNFPYGSNLSKNSLGKVKEGVLGNNYCR